MKKKNEKRECEDRIIDYLPTLHESDKKNRIIDLPDNKFIITNLDLPEEKLIDMYYNGLYNDLACDCPLCKKNNSC